RINATKTTKAQPYETLLRRFNSLSRYGSARQHSAVPFCAQKRATGTAPPGIGSRNTDRLRRSARLPVFGKTRVGSTQPATRDYQRGRRHCSVFDRTAHGFSARRRSFGRVARGRALHRAPRDSACRWSIRVGGAAAVRAVGAECHWEIAARCDDRMGFERTDSAVFDVALSRAETARTDCHGKTDGDVARDVGGADVHEWRG